MSRDCQHYTIFCISLIVLKYILKPVKTHCNMYEKKSRILSKEINKRIFFLLGKKKDCKD